MPSSPHLLILRRTFRQPFGGLTKTCLCLAVGTPECSGKIWNFRSSENAGDCRRNSPNLPTPTNADKSRHGKEGEGIRTMRLVSCVVREWMAPTWGNGTTQPNPQA